MEITVDTNVLVYAAEREERGRGDIALQVVSAVRERRGALSLQVCGEAFHVLHRKKKWPGTEARAYASALITGYRSFSTTPASVARAMDIAARGHLSFWDANLVSAAEAAGCTHLLSEDMNDGERFGRLEIVNPFSGDALSERARDLLQL